MRRLIAPFCGALAALAFAGAAGADVKLNSIRIGAKDVEAAGKFYAATFGMHETNRLKVAAGYELFLNFGATVEEARANNGARIVILPAEPVQDPVAHVIFTVSDAAATAAAARAAGGTITREPARYGDTQIVIGFVADPAGNLIELIQPAPRQ